MIEHNAYEFLAYKGRDAAAIPSLVDAVSHVFGNSFGTTPQGKPYRLGPKKTKERLESTDLLIVAQHQSKELLATSMPEFFPTLVGLLGGSTHWRFFLTTDERKWRHDSWIH